MRSKTLSILSLKKKCIWILALGLFLANNLVAQEFAQDADTTRKNAIRLFIDCRSCDMNYIREEMPYINYVRDVREAQVYLLVTRQATGSGGAGYTLFFSGHESFSGMTDTLVYNSSPDDTPPPLSGSCLALSRE